jgi:hypothetical protein
MSTKLERMFCPHAALKIISKYALIINKLRSFNNFCLACEQNLYSRTLVLYFIVPKQQLHIAFVAVG